MSDLKAVNPIIVKEQLDRLKLWKFNPSECSQYFLGHMNDVYEGRAGILEPSNPIGYLLDMAAVGNVFTIQEHVLGLRKLYPALANTELDLYRHMSDYDYKDVFSSPAIANVTINVMLNDFLSKAYIDPVSGDKILTIPKYSNIRIEDFVFTIFSPITIRITESGIPDVRFIGSDTDDIFPIDTDYIQFDTMSLNQKERYIQFKVRAPELEVTAHETMVSSGRKTGTSINFPVNRQFYFAKVYYNNPSTGEWTQMLTTHTEDIWDIKKPTCIVQLDTVRSVVHFNVPPIYVNRFDLGDKLKIVLYTTKGPINVNFSDYRLDDFTLDYSGVFPQLETSPETDPLSRITVKQYIQDKVIGGRNGVTTEELKDIVINNSLVPNIPITENQMERSLKNTELNPIKNYDVVTGREYLIKVKIPSSVSKYEVARASYALIEFKTSFEDLRNNKNGVYEVNKEILVIPSGTLFLMSNTNGAKILTKSEQERIKNLSGQALTREVNSNNYMSLYYHYVLDDIDDFTQLRAYDVDHPALLSSNFKNYNRSTLVSVNSRSLKIVKTDTGYRIYVLVDYKEFNEQYDVSDVLPLLAYISESGFRYFLEGKLYGNTEQGKVMSFDIDTDGYIDRQDRIYVNNFRDTNGDVIQTYFDIEQELNIIYTTSKVPPKFIASEIDEVLYGSHLAGSYIGITQEVHKFKFAHNYKNLYKRVHTSTGKDIFQTHDKDEYMTYSHTIFGEGNKVIHRPGEFVLDDKGNKIIKFHKGDIKLDKDNNPIVMGREDLARFINILLVDYKFLLDKTPLTTNYLEDVRLHLDTIINNNAEFINEDMLEITEALVTVPNGLTEILVRYDGKTGYIKPNQTFNIDLNVTDRVINDDQTKKVLELTIKETLDQYLSGRMTLKKNVMEEILFAKVKGTVSGLTVSSMTELDANYLEILDDNGEVSISKWLDVIPNGYKVTDDVRFNYIKVADENDVMREVNLSDEIRI